VNKNFSIAALALALLAPAAFAQNADLKRAQEIVDNRCSLCHGAQGDSTSPIYPRLASQNPEYIAKQLADFKSGRRKGNSMNDQAASLSEDEMKALGVFFSQKKPKSYTIRNEGLNAVGRYIYHSGNPYSGVAACAGCHGPEGGGTVQLPRLAGQHAAYLEGQLKDFNQRARTNDNAVMHSIASKLTELEIKAVTLYLSGLQ
jgi:cytochrome c553